jgi:FkbM family methyltransferase
MKGVIKDILRKFFISCRIPITRNIRYDILTQQILQSVLKSNSSCVDVGAHKGEMLALIRKYAPQGRHFAFEPIPAMFAQLQQTVSSDVKVFPFALSNYNGKTTFHLVKDEPAYSGIKRREYKTANPIVEVIEVEVMRMDDVLQKREVSIDLIKIDVEGGELDVMRGAESILKKDRPVLVFECGKGASEFYNNSPEMVFDFLHQLSYSIYLLDAFLAGGSAFERDQFVDAFHQGSDYYFIAAARK